MTMRSRDLSQMPADTATLGKQLMSPTNPYRVIGEHLADIIQDDQFADMYQERGRNAVSPSLLALVTLFQFQEKVTDREAAEMVVMRLDWKYALHLPLDYAGFDYSILCDFRQRVLAHQQESLLFDTILKKVESLGFIKKRGKQRTDSLAVVGAVRELSVLETVSETLRTTLRAMRKADAAWVEEAVPAVFRDVYADSRSDYKLTEQERADELREVGEDGFWLLELVDARGSEVVRQLEELQTMRTVWEQRYHWVDGKVAPRADLPQMKEVVVTPHDPGIRVGKKRGKTWLGEKVHVSETAETGEQSFITDVTTTNAASRDNESLPEVREQLAERDLKPGEQYVDAGYVTGKSIADSEADGVILMGPPLRDTSSNTLKISAFTIDRVAKEAICPQGQRSVKWSEKTNPNGSSYASIQFAAQSCIACVQREQCTESPRGRALHLNEHYELLEARRAEAKTEEFKEKMRARPAIEATLSELVRGYGMRRHRYRGEAKRHFENLLKATACNLQRLVRALLVRWERASKVEVSRGELAVAVR